MTTRDQDGAAADDADNRDTEKTTNSIDANSSSNNQSPSNAHGASKKQWFRSIPRRIRKFITKHHHRHGHTADDSVANEATTSNAVYANQTFVDDGDGLDESQLYSTVDYLDNYEEVAMIRACSQMAR